MPPENAAIPGRPSPKPNPGQGHDPKNPAQADPTALRAEVEPYALLLARSLRPATAPRGRRPHESRGDLDPERVLDGADRVYMGRDTDSPKPSEAWFILVDVSTSMGSAATPGTPMNGTRRATMYLNVAAERAGISLGLAAFDDQPTMISIRDLCLGPNPLGDRRIAGLDSGGNTLLAPALKCAGQALIHYQAARKILPVLHDGDLIPADAAATRQIVEQLTKAHIHVLPLYLGSDSKVIAANKRVFGDVLACTDLGSLTTLFLSWYRAWAR